MKMINYRGVVRFRVPASWKEEYSDTDGGIFYEDKPDSGTLRLKLITVTTPSQINSDSAIRLIKDLKHIRAAPASLPNGNAVAQFEESSLERGQRIKIFYWLVSNPVPPKHARLANFSYAILEEHERAPLVPQVLQMLDQQIRSAEFSKELGS